MKTLTDGRQVENDSPEWRLESLARHVLALPTLVERRAWLADFEKSAGARASADVMTAMQLVHAARRQGRACP